MDWVPTVEEKEPAGVAQTTTDVEDVTFTSSVSEQKQRYEALDRQRIQDEANAAKREALRRQRIQDEANAAAAAATAERIAAASIVQITCIICYRKFPDGVELTCCPGSVYVPHVISRNKSYKTRL